MNAEAIRLTQDLPEIGGRPGDYLLTKDDGRVFLVREFAEDWRAAFPELAALVEPGSARAQVWSRGLRAVG